MPFSYGIEVIKIKGQPSLFLLDLTGKEYPAMAEVNRKKRVNGQRELSLSFLYDEVNQDFMHDIEFGWQILFKGEWYTITSPSYALDGDRFSVGVDAVLSFFVDMNGHYLQDEVENKSSTAANFFRDLFDGTGYNYVLVDNLTANTLSYQANQSKTERFLYGIDRFNAEYVIRGKLAYIYGLIGSDKDVILHEDLNIQDVSIEVDGSGFHTWAKGFGDKDENEEDADYKLEVEEHIPALVEKHGWIEGPAIRDGSYKYETNLKSAVRKQIENSFKISTTITAVDLTNNGYPEMQFEEGDRVWLYVTDLKQNQQVRVVEIDETFDWEGNIISSQYTVGNEGIAARYKTQQYSTLKDFRDIASGRKKLEYNWLPEAIQRASDIINGNLDSHFKYGAGEIIGINKSNPNGYMRFNTDGIGFSRDGGKTYRSAMTYEGIVADAITAGTIRGIIIEGVEIYGSEIFGGIFTGGIIKSQNTNTNWNLNSGDFEMERSRMILGSGARIDFTNVSNRIQYRDTRDGIVRSAGFGVGKSLQDYPFAYSGTTGDANLDTLSPYYSGAIWHTTKGISEGAANSINGGRFQWRNKAVGWDKALTIDFTESITTITPLSHGDYDFGKPNLRYRRMYVDNILGWDTVYISNPTANRGFQIGTDYSDGRNPSIRGQYPSENNYNLGEDWAPFSYTYTNTIYRNYEHEFSSHASKMNIKDIDIDLAELYVDGTDIKNFYYKNQYKENDYVNPFNLRSGVIIEQLEDSVKYLVKGDEDSVDATSIPYILQAVLKSTRKEFSQFKEETFLLIENLIKEVESLKIGA